MARYQQLNPLDQMFYAGNELRKRMGLTGINVQLILELRGPLDLAGFKAALAALHRLYPATGARLECTPITGQPRWRLDGENNLSRAIRLHTLNPATRQQMHAQTQQLLREPLDTRSGPLVQFHLFRGLPTGDILAMRWPHALMDARGGMIVLEQIQQLYEEKPVLNTLQSLGDEDRDDVGKLIAKIDASQRVKALGGKTLGSLPQDWQDIHLASGSPINDPQGLHYTVRHLDLEQAQQVRDTSMRVCGFARMGDFVRACAIQALHRTTDHRPRGNAGYSTMQLVDNRKRRQLGPVCRNYFSALPVYVPLKIADDRRATADVIAEYTAEALSSGLIATKYAAMERLARLPVSVLVELMLRAYRPGAPRFLKRGLANTPSLPMGFMGSFTKPLPSFCGAGWDNVYGMGVIMPHEGFGLNLTTPNDSKRLNITATYFEPRVTSATMETFLDRFIEALTNPE